MEPITFFNRYTRRLENENVYGLGWVAWTYGNPVGRASLHALVKRAWFSRWYGRRMDDPASREKIAPFLEKYSIDTTELADPVASYRTFNEFFYRRLRPAARPVDQAETSAVFPADGRHLGFQDVSQAPGFFVKGQQLNLRRLLQDDNLAQEYERGSMVLSRLCPVDYHRFHFPVGGRAGKVQTIPGPLFSVNPIALRRNLSILTENKRAWCRIESPQFGPVLMLEIGATCVGSFVYTHPPDHDVEKGREKGYFKFGGSSTIVLFQQGRVQLDADLLEQSAQQRELYARMGDRMGVVGSGA